MHPLKAQLLNLPDLLNKWRMLNRVHLIRHITLIVWYYTLTTIRGSLHGYNIATAMRLFRHVGLLLPRSLTTQIPRNDCHCLTHYPNRFSPHPLIIFLIFLPQTPLTTEPLLAISVAMTDTPTPITKIRKPLELDTYPSHKFQSSPKFTTLRKRPQNIQINSNSQKLTTGLVVFWVSHL